MKEYRGMTFEHIQKTHYITAGCSKEPNGSKSPHSIVQGKHKDASSIQKYST